MTKKRRTIPVYLSVFYPRVNLFSLYQKVYRLRITYPYSRLFARLFPFLFLLLYRGLGLGFGIGACVFLLAWRYWLGDISQLYWPVILASYIGHLYWPVILASYHRVGKCRETFLPDFRSCDRPKPLVTGDRVSQTLFASNADRRHFLALRFG